MVTSFLDLLSIFSLILFLDAVTCARVPGQCSSSLLRPVSTSFAPSSWSTEEIIAQEKMNDDLGKKQQQTGPAVVTGTSSAPAVLVGQKCLISGGNAADCAIATAFAQVALCAGQYVSYSGHAFLTYYDATSKQVYSLNGGFNTISGETSPLTIPNCSVVGPHAARSVLTGGFMDAMQEASDCLGRLSWSNVVEPAVEFAKNGFNVSHLLAAQISAFSSVWNATSVGRSIFTKNSSSSSPYVAGDLFKQPDLADFLSNVQQTGAQYYYNGSFAKKLVDALTKIEKKEKKNDREAGEHDEEGDVYSSAITLDDLKRYKSVWQSPLMTTFSTQIQKQKEGLIEEDTIYEVYSSGLLSAGGLHLIEEVNLLESFSLASDSGIDFSQYALNSSSSSFATAASAALFPLLFAASYTWLLSVICEVVPVQQGVAVVEERFESRTGVQVKLVDPNERSSKKTAQQIYNFTKTELGRQMIADVFQPFLAIGQVAAESEYVASILKAATNRPSHSDAVVVVDSSGNVASLLHSMNGLPWGTGIFVDGVALTHTACNQQQRVNLTGPGNRLQDDTEPTIVLKDGAPFLAGSVIGTSLRESSLFHLMSLISRSESQLAAADADNDYATHSVFNAVFPTAKTCQGDKTRPGCHFPLNMSVSHSSFSNDVINSVHDLGIDLSFIDNAVISSNRGWWVGAKLSSCAPTIDSTSTATSCNWEASAPEFLNGQALAVPTNEATV